eukprot:1176524-Prorocentrum_minimum.AAC.1
MTAKHQLKTASVVICSVLRQPRVPSPAPRSKAAKGKLSHQASDRGCDSSYSLSLSGGSRSNVKKPTCIARYCWAPR